MTPTPLPPIPALVDGFAELVGFEQILVITGGIFLLSSIIYSFIKLSRFILNGLS